MTTRDFMACGRLLPAWCMLLFGVPAVAQHQPTITSIDAPGAGTTSGYGTLIQAINPAGVIAGYYVGFDNVAHAYVRTPDGWFTSFDGPGVPLSAPTGPLSPPSPWANTSAPGTYAAAINALGAVAGYYIDANYVAHGYVRTPDGRFTSFDVPHAGKAAGQGTLSTNINLEGTIAGSYVDADNASHAFLRTRDGAIAEFDVPGSSGTWLGWAQCISTTGAINGTYADAAGVDHGFVRYPNGEMTTFEVAASGLGAGQGTNTWSINAAGATAGAFVDAGNAYHGLVRNAAGKITIFDVQGAVNTTVENIGPTGVAVGDYKDANSAHHGFMRSSQGELSFFDIPGAGGGPGQGTVPLFNTADTVVGFWVDDNYVWHGFVRQ